MKATIPKKPEDDDVLLEESDELPSDFDMSEEGEDDEEDEGEEDELAEESDNEDLLSLDGEVPEGLIEYDGTEWGGVELEEAGEKRKRRDEWKDRRKKLRSLPTFASYDEYAKMIEDQPEDHI